MKKMNIEQQRAAYALETVSKKTQPIDQAAKKEWLSRANELPAMIQMNGLGATLAFYKMKNTAAHQGLLNILQEWLCAEEGIYPGEKNLIEAVVQGDMYHYRAAQAEAQALLIWVKKFSKIYCRDDIKDKEPDHE